MPTRPSSNYRISSGLSCLSIFRETAFHFNPLRDNLSSRNPRRVPRVQNQPSPHPLIAMLRTTVRLPVRTLPQPDETTCGPTCLHAMYNYWGKTEPLKSVIVRTRKLESGSGTFAVFLGCDALRNGFQATIYTYNLMMFDPTWFAPGMDIAERLRQQRELKPEPRLRHATEGYLEFLRLGGRLRLTDLSQSLVHGLLRRGLPILTGLSSTYLYRAAREYGPDDTPDDVRGFPAGHFVVLTGYDPGSAPCLWPILMVLFRSTGAISTACWARCCWELLRMTPICW